MVCCKGSQVHRQSALKSMLLGVYMIHRSKVSDQGHFSPGQRFSFSHVDSAFTVGFRQVVRKSIHQQAVKLVHGCNPSCHEQAGSTDCEAFRFY